MKINIYTAGLDWGFGKGVKEGLGGLGVVWPLQEDLLILTEVAENAVLRELALGMSQGEGRSTQKAKTEVTKAAAKARYRSTLDTFLWKKNSAPAQIHPHQNPIISEGSSLASTTPPVL